ncbi:MAG: hypothetical protein AAF513_19900 [Pseudomonadota bacterium]
MKLLRIAFVLTALQLMGCSSGSDRATSDQAAADSQPPALRHYAGPGSRWDVRLNADFTFSIERRARIDTPVVLTVTGTYQELDSGFLQLVVGAAQGEDAPTPGQTAWAIEVPGYALFLKPDESPFGGFITMVDGGNCPSSDLTANWTVMRPAASASADSASVAHVGSLAYTAASANLCITQRRSLTALDTELGSVDLGVGECADGVIATSQAMIYLTAAGGALVHTNHPDDAEREIVFAMQDAPLAAVSDLDGDYIGLIYDVGNPSGNNVAPTTLTCTAGLCAGSLYDSIGLVTAVQTFVADLFGSLNLPGAGMTSGQVRTDAGAGALACQSLSYAPGQVLLACLGQDPEDATRQITMVARSR